MPRPYHPNHAMISRSIRFALPALCALFFARAALANSEIYPPAPAAEAAIHWKEGYFYVNGKPTFLTSGEMHYARIPRELWRDRIWRAKQMGFNCIQTYVFWNSDGGPRGEVGF